MAGRIFDCESEWFDPPAQALRGLARNVVGAFRDGTARIWDATGPVSPASRRRSRRSLLITRDDGASRVLQAPAGIDVAELLPNGRLVAGNAERRHRVFSPSGAVLADLEMERAPSGDELQFGARASATSKLRLGDSAGSAGSDRTPSGDELREGASATAAA